MWVWTHQNRLFQETIFRPLGGADPWNRWVVGWSVLHALQIDQLLLAHPTNRVVGPPENFKDQHLKLGLKFHIRAPITLAIVGVTSQNFTTGCSSWPGWSSDTDFARGAPYKILEGKKCPKFSAICNNFRHWSQISPERINIFKILKLLHQTHFIPYCTKKILVNFGPLTKKL